MVEVHGVGATLQRSPRGRDPVWDQAWERYTWRVRGEALSPNHYRMPLAREAARPPAERAAPESTMVTLVLNPAILRGGI